MQNTCRIHRIIMTFLPINRLYILNYMFNDKMLIEILHVDKTLTTNFAIYWLILFLETDYWIELTAWTILCFLSDLLQLNTFPQRSQRVFMFDSLTYFVKSSDVNWFGVYLSGWMVCTFICCCIVWINYWSGLNQDSLNIFINIWLQVCYVWK